MLQFINTDRPECRLFCLVRTHSTISISKNVSARDYERTYTVNDRLPYALLLRCNVSGESSSNYIAIIPYTYHSTYRF